MQIEHRIADQARLMGCEIAQSQDGDGHVLSGAGLEGRGETPEAALDALAAAWVRYCRQRDLDAQTARIAELAALQQDA